VLSKIILAYVVLMPELGLDQEQEGEPIGSVKDERIQRVVTLGFGFGA